MPKKVLIVGTGTIGEPLIGLFSVLKKDMGIDDVYFHKRTPLRYEIAKVNSLINRGAKLVVNNDCISQFEQLGHSVHCVYEQALEECDVIVDCTPAGNNNKAASYLDLSETYPHKTFIAQGSENGFGLPYAYGINDSILTSKENKFIQVVSCNTHSIACLVNNLHHSFGVVGGDFVCIRRPNDLSQDGGFIASPYLSLHSSINGTHHAKDVVDLFKTKDISFKDSLYSSAMKTNTQYMHVIRYNIETTGQHSYNKILDTLKENHMISLTRHRSANRVFSFGRDHGFYGRIYNQTVVSIPALEVHTKRETTMVTGFSFTPQDGNSLLSSAAATLYGLHGKKYLSWMSCFSKFLHKEI